MLRAILFLTLLLPTTAWATCMLQCEVKLVNLSCAVQPDGSAIPAAGPLLFAADCKTCCSPPGGPVTCNATDPASMSWQVFDSSDKPVAGGFSDLKQKCTDGEMFGFAPSGPLPADSYQLLQGNMILAHFVVAPPANNCQSNADCGTCAVCISGNCMGMGLVECNQDTDCKAGQICQPGAAACENKCVAKPGCSSNADCPKCTFCVAGECKGMGLSQCQQNGDCPPNSTCQIGECGNLCVAMATDAGPSDVAQSDTVQADSAQSDAAQTDAAQAETTASDGAAVDAATDSGPDGTVDSGSSDVCTTCDAAQDGGADVADAGPLDAAPTDTGSAAAGAPASSSSCAASRTAETPWAMWLALAAVALLRRRKLA